MTTNRIIPYGYAVQNGQTVIHPDESAIVRHIFIDYLSGASLLAVARALTREGVPFLPGRSDWNKNRVKRILGDIRYTGMDTYPTLIKQDMYQRVQAVKQSRTDKRPLEKAPDSGTDFSPTVHAQLKCVMECACGAKMAHRHDARRKVSADLWQCMNPDCQRVVNKNDDILLYEITALLNRLIEHPSLIQMETGVQNEPPLEVRRLQGEVNHQLDSSDFDEVRVKSDIFALATEKYRQIDNDSVISLMLRTEFAKAAPLLCVSLDVFQHSVLKIQFSENGDTILILKNHQKIGKEISHADNGNDPADENRAENPGQTGVYCCGDRAEIPSCGGLLPGIHGQG